jgi:hypothetical protein
VKPSGKNKGIYRKSIVVKAHTERLISGQITEEMELICNVDSRITVSVRNDIFVYFWLEAFFQERQTVVSAKHHYGNGVSFPGEHLSSLSDANKRSLA